MTAPLFHSLNNASPLLRAISVEPHSSRGTVGFPRGLTRPTCKKPVHCLWNGHDRCSRSLGVYPVADIEQVLREKKPFTLRCMLDGIKELPGRGVKWHRVASNVSSAEACLLV